MNYVNIINYYGKFSDVDKPSPIPILPELSPKNWREFNSFKSPDMSPPNKTLKAILSPPRHQRLPAITSGENTPSKKRMSRHQTSTSPKSNNYSINLKKSESNNGLEKFKILSFEQKSLLQKKTELNHSYAKLQRKLTRLIEAKEEEEGINNLDVSGGVGGTTVDQEEDFDYELNFIKGKTSQNNSPLRLNTLAADSVYSDYVATEESSPLKSNGESVTSPYRRKIKSHLHESLKYKLIKKLGIDKLYHNQTETSDILQKQASFLNESKDILPRSPTAIKLQGYGSFYTPSPRASASSGILKKMQNRSVNINNTPSFEASRLSFHSQSQSQVGLTPTPLPKPMEKKASKSIYGRIHKIIGTK